MAPTELNIFFSVSAFFLIIFAGWFPFKQRLTTNQHLELPVGETLATGVFLGAAMIHMLPESNAIFVADGYRFPYAFMITGIAFLLFLWFEHLCKEFYHHHDAKDHFAFAILAWMMLCIHSLVLGTALGLSHDYPTRIMLFLAIIAHKWAESFAIAVQLNKSSLSFNLSLVCFIIFALMTPLGIGFGSYFEQAVSSKSLVVPILIAVSAGTFLYLGTLHGLERCVMVERCCNLRDFSFVIIGFLLMASVAIYT